MRNIKCNIIGRNRTISIVLICFLSLIKGIAQDCISRINTSELDGANGFLINGVDSADMSGWSVKNAGDINNDTIDDLIIGAYWADPNGNDKFGEVYVLFGTAMGMPASFDLSSLNGINGFKIDGIDSWTGREVSSAGDINNDGIDDIMLNAIYTNSHQVDVGSVYVIYGTSTGFPSTFDLNLLDGSNGFVINGVDPGDLTGISLSNAGDINDDAIDDIIIGAQGASPNTTNKAGRSYVIFGKSLAFGSVFELSDLNGTNGFVINGVNIDDESGSKVANAGDINGDGIHDIMISATGADQNGANSGQVYVIFGSNIPFSSSIELSGLNGTNGFVINGEGTGDFLGGGIGSIGDINNDGIKDIAISARQSFPGKVYVIFGSTTPFSSTFELNTLNGTNGFVIEGLSVLSINDAGDFNNDGINDFIMGVPYWVSSQRGGYIVYGNPGPWQNRIGINDINHLRIFEDGIQENLGYDVGGIGDFNKDGISDIIIGAPAVFERDEINGLTGTSYVVFGGDYCATPLNTGYPQAINETVSGFTLVVNGPETGTIHYAILPGTFSGTIDHDAILNGTGAVVNGNFLMNTANTDIQEIISSLTAGTTYDVYLFLEDGAGNQGEIYHINDVTTLSGTDTPPPTITCPSNQAIACNSTVIPDFISLVTASDIVDPNPVITQNPVPGSAFTDGMTVTMTATDASSNSASCTFVVTRGVDDEKPVLACLTSESLFVNSTLPNFYLKLGVSDNCTSLFDLTYTQTPAQGTVFTADTNVTVTVTDGNGNTESCSFLVTVRPAITPLDCTTTSISINDLDGNIGFQIDGNRIKGETGYDVREAGDVNGDGIEDFLVGSPGKAYNFNSSYGREIGNFPGDVFVIFGKGNNFLPNLDTTLLDGTNGFKISNDISGGNFQFSGYQVSTAGDINNDGIDDLMFSDPFRNDGLGAELGTTYVVFGKTSGFSPVFNVSSIDGTNGFVFMGADPYDQSALSFDSAEDINNDGINDIIIGARSARFTDTSGKCYIVYGSSTAFPALLRGRDLNGSNGFIIKGDADGEGIGNGVVGLGDVNGDGIDDVGFEGGNTNKTYVLFGKTGGFSSIVPTATIDGTTGFYVDVSSFSSSSFYKTITGVGDVNDDGVNDILFGNKRLFFGKNTSFSAAEDITNLNGTNGVDFTGNNYRVSSAGGDFNNDGIDDLIVGQFGSIAIVYGKNTPWNATLNPFSLPSSEVFIVSRSNSGDYPVSDLGDINGDGITDVIIGEKERLYYDSGSSLDPGHAYIIYGFSIPNTQTPQITTCPSDQTLSSGSPLPDYTGAVSAIDDCDTNLEITQDPIAGTLFTADTTVTMTVTDNSGKETQCSFEVRTPTLAPIVNLSVSSNTGTEAAGTIITVTATSSIAVVGDQTIDIGIAGIGITPSDFTLSNTSITIPDGMITGTVTFTIVDDALVESTETAIVTISNPSTGITLGTTTTQDVVITDNDSAPIPTVNLSVSSNTGTEAAGTVITVTATSSGAVVGAQTIDLATTGVGITASDFTLSNTTITIPDGMTTGTVTFTIVDDALVEGTETATLTISNPSTGITLGTTTAQNIDITDNDSAPIPTVNLSVSSNTGTEAAGTVITVTATSSGAVVGAQTIDLATTGVGITASDFTLSNTTITIPDGMTTGTVTFTIVDDALVESTETAIVTISNPSAGITLGTTTTQDVVIEDNDDLIICTIEAGEDEEITQGQEVRLNAIASGSGTFVWTPSTGLTNTDIANPIANPNQTTTYTVVFTSDQGCIEEDIVTVYVEAQEEDQTRYGFSPDGDGINEYWEIHNIENYPNNKVSIYNRWGDIVFEVEGYNNTSRVFRGIANRKRSLGGDKLPEGTYFFNIKIEGSHNLKKQTGFLVLKR
ncbi:T9SS C-terminal target domain-containing protein [Aquimarina macrocephali]|uniref:T9SS C-terminal target domain-containing protein n=1 Tax=Aquimarina macrocephali TaxID=666563 RepID=UPI000464474B|nr:T9SS C-terminal target domain-containing protein [Aquimarina macrocephali]